MTPEGPVDGIVVVEARMWTPSLPVFRWWAYDRFPKDPQPVAIRVSAEFLSGDQRCPTLSSSDTTPMPRSGRSRSRSRARPRLRPGIPSDAAAPVRPGPRSRILRRAAAGGDRRGGRDPLRTQPRARRVRSRRRARRLGLAVAAAARGRRRRDRSLPRDVGEIHASCNHGMSRSRCVAAASGSVAEGRTDGSANPILAGLLRRHGGSPLPRGRPSARRGG